MNYAELSDAELAALARENDAKAEETLIERYVGAAEEIARRYVGRSGRLADLRQSGIIGAWKAIRRFDPAKRAEFEPFARRCIKTAILDCIRRNFARTDEFNLGESEIASDADDPKSEGLNPESAYATNLREREFYGALKEILTDAQLTALRLFHVEGYSYGDIAAKLGVDKKKVDNLLSAARKKVRENRGML